MRILLTAATTFEIQPVVDFLRHQTHGKEKDRHPNQQTVSGQTDQIRPETFFFNGHHIDILVCGIGIMNTTYSLTDHLHHHSPGYVLQAGIGGSFSDNFPPLSMAFVKEEIAGDLGVEENGDFKDIFDLGFMRPDQHPYTGKSLVNPHIANWTAFQLPFVTAVTINEISTRPARIHALQQKYQPVVESMEGSAFHYVCLKKGIPFVQLRSISNKVGDRDKSHWKIKEAVTLLNEKIIEMLLHFPVLDE